MSGPLIEAAQRLQAARTTGAPVWTEVDDALAVFRSIDVAAAARALDPGAYDDDAGGDYAAQAERRRAAVLAVKALKSHLTEEPTP